MREKAARKSWTHKLSRLSMPQKEKHAAHICGHSKLFASEVGLFFFVDDVVVVVFVGRGGGGGGGRDGLFE